MRRRVRGLPPAQVGTFGELKKLPAPFEDRGRGEIHADPPRDRRVVFVAAQMKRAASSVFDDGEIVRGVASRRLIRSPSAWNAVTVERLRRPGFDGRGLGRGAGRVVRAKSKPGNQTSDNRRQQ